MKINFSRKVKKKSHRAFLVALEKLLDIFIFCSEKVPKIIAESIKMFFFHSLGIRSSNVSGIERVTEATLAINGFEVAAARNFVSAKRAVIQEVFARHREIKHDLSQGCLSVVLLVFVANTWRHQNIDLF